MTEEKRIKLLTYYDSTLKIYFTSDYNLNVSDNYIRMCLKRFINQAFDLKIPISNLNIDKM